jgi:hypothetical protein
MIETNVFHALGLHMHQPPGNLGLLIDTDPWEAEQIIRCYERPARYAHNYADVAKLHVGFSGVLLEQLRDPVIVDRYRHIVDIPAMLAAYAEADNIELIGMGYYHPIFPLIPPADWKEQLQLGREMMQDTFGRAARGFWPPEMAFSMAMIPALVEAGYEYVVVDGVHVHPEDGVADVFRPYLACHDNVCIAVVPRDRDVSNAQESGLDATWFAHEVTHRCRFSARPHEHRLVTTWSDGENGGWFRQMHEGSGFFGHYFAPYMEHVRGGDYPVRPVALGDYLQTHQPSAHARVQTGAWNVGATSGFDLAQWAGTERQQRAVTRVTDQSRRWWSLAGRRERFGKDGLRRLAEARKSLLTSETSCYLFWGDDWLPKLDQLADETDRLLAAVEHGAEPAGAPGNGPSTQEPPMQAGGASQTHAGASPAAAADKAADSKTSAEPPEVPERTGAGAEASKDNDTSVIPGPSVASGASEKAARQSPIRSGADASEAAGRSKSAKPRQRPPGGRRDPSAPADPAASGDVARAKATKKTKARSSAEHGGTQTHAGPDRREARAPSAKPAGVAKKNRKVEPGSES